MVGFLLALSYLAAHPQVSGVEMKRVAVTDQISISIPAKAKPDPENRKQSGDDRVWLFDDGAADYVVEIVSSYAKRDPSITPDQAVAAALTAKLDDTDKPVIKRQQDLILNGWTGLEVLVSREIKGIGTSVLLGRAFAVQKDVYIVGVGYDPTGGRPKAAEEFLNSVAIAAAAHPGPLKTAGPVLTTFAPSGGKFSIGMPSVPKEDLKGMGKATAHRFEVVYGNRVYLATYLAFPDEAPDPSQGQKNEALATIVDQIANSLQGKRASEPKTFSRDGTDFVRLDCSGPDGRIGRIETAIAARRIYVLFMIYPASYAGSPDIDTFFNSFKLLPPEPKTK